MKPRDTVLAVCLLMVIAGCRPKPSAETAQQLSRVIAVGIDVTGSHVLRDKAPAVLSEVFEASARPGDTWVIRQISQASYSDRAALLTIQLPDTMKEPDNPFDFQEQAEFQARRQRYQQARSEAVSSIRRLRLPPPVRGSDIWGFVAKAADLGATHVLIFSDLGDTVHLRSAQKLNHAEVHVFFQSGRDPRLAHRRREEWSRWFLEIGAAKVVFHDPNSTTPVI